MAEVSKINYYAVLKAPDMAVSKVNYYIVTRAPDMAVSKINYYVVLAEPRSNKPLMMVIS